MEMVWRRAFYVEGKYSRCKRLGMVDPAASVYMSLYHVSSKLKPPLTTLVQS